MTLTEVKNIGKNYVEGPLAKRGETEQEFIGKKA